MFYAQVTCALTSGNLANSSETADKMTAGTGKKYFCLNLIYYY